MTSPTGGRRFSRLVRVLVPVSILGVILLAVTTVGFIEYSAQPSFCDNCHIMEPYYQSWQTSSHRDVPCIACHYAPGIKAEAMGKLQAANQVVRYVTRTYSVKPWAEIEDAACLRSGCHSERKVEGLVDYAGVRFNHTDHLGELRRGKQLRCTSCHSQIVQGEHLSVTPVTCYLCHFKDRPAGDPVAGCTGCHAQLPRVVSPAGYVVDHEQYVRDRISCVSCHQEVTTGSGAADRARCFNCHNEPERLAKFEDTTLVHRVHIADRNVECTQCHTPIEHRITALATTFDLDCGSCHAGAHEDQRRLYAGMGGHDSPTAPSKMFLARVSCRGCHGMATTVRGHESVQMAGEASCLSCHGIRYVNLLPSWQREMERRLARVEPVVRGARAQLGAAPVRRRAAADSLLRLAQENVDLVRRGRAAHNIVYADTLLRAAIGLTRQAVRVGQLPYTVPAVNLGPAVTESACFSCHLGVERSAVAFQGAQFPHEPHVMRGSLSCADCHTPLADHGGTTITSQAQCNACHHQQIRPMNCAACHPGPGGAPEATVAHRVGDFSHNTHTAGGVACADCHVPPTMDAAAVRCQNCHEQHHAPERSCLSCHRGGVMRTHDRSVHTACGECHDLPPTIGRWTPQVCTVCHVTQAAGHYPDRACDACHQIPAMRQGGGG